MAKCGQRASDALRIFFHKCGKHGGLELISLLLVGLVSAKKYERRKGRGDASLLGLDPMIFAEGNGCYCKSCIWEKLVFSCFFLVIGHNSSKGEY